MKAATVMAGAALIALSGCQQAANETAPANGTAAASTTPTTPPLTSGAAPAPPSAAPTASLGKATDSKGELRMDVTEATRAGGVLTIKTRFTMIGGKAGTHALPGAMGSAVYLTAGNKKYMMLKDDADKELMSSNLYPNFDQVGASVSWWGKFPAPPADVKAVNFYFSDFEPVENVAIVDR